MVIGTHEKVETLEDVLENGKPYRSGMPISS
jgi:hypothetical protein